MKESRAFSKLMEEYQKKTYSQQKKHHTVREQFKGLEDDMKEISDVFPKMAGAMKAGKAFHDVSSITFLELVENGVDIAVKGLVAEVIAHGADAKKHGGGRRNRTRRVRPTRRPKAGCRKGTRNTRRNRRV